jgi:hypothetical protein
MSTVHIEAQVSTEQLLRAVEQLSPPEFSAVVAKLLALRAERESTHLDQTETALLREINSAQPPETRRRFETLIAKRQDESISPAELDELIRLTAQCEERDVRRLEALEALAQRRHITLAALMTSLGIPPPGHAG